MTIFFKNCCAEHSLSRRSLLQTLLTGIAVSPFLLISQKANAEIHHAKALVLSCIDFRFINAEQNFLTQTLAGQYDCSFSGGIFSVNGLSSPCRSDRLLGSTGTL